MVTYETEYFPPFAAPDGAGANDLAPNISNKHKTFEGTGMSSPSMLICKLNRTGDAVAFLPIVSALRKVFPVSLIDLVCTDRTSTIFDSSVANIRTIPVPRRAVHGPRGASALPSVLRRLGRVNYDYALLSHDEPAFAYLLALASLSRHRVGFDLIHQRLKFLLWKVLRFSHSRNIVDTNFDLVRHISGQPSLAPTRVPVGYSREDAFYVERRLASFGMPPDAPLIVIHPFARLSYKEWGVRKYLTVAQRVTEKHGVLALFVCQEVPPGLDWPFLLQDLSIHQLAALLERARLFIGNNSAPMHIAAAMGTPTLIIQGPSPPEWNVPWRDADHRRLIAQHLPCVPCERMGRVVGFCTNKDYPNGCMSEISPEIVIEYALEMMGK